MRITGIDHVQLAMPPGRERDAVEFYEGLLGIPQVAKPANLAVRGGCWFERGDLKIHLGVEDDFRPAKKAHPALLVQGLPQLLDHLRGCAVECQNAALDGFANALVDDPSAIDRKLSR